MTVDVTKGISTLFIPNNLSNLYIHSVGVTCLSNLYIHLVGVTCLDLLEDRLPELCLIFNTVVVNLGTDQII